MYDDRTKDQIKDSPPLEETSLTADPAYRDQLGTYGRGTYNVATFEPNRNGWRLVRPQGRSSPVPRECSRSRQSMLIVRSPRAICTSGRLGSRESANTARLAGGPAPYPSSASTLRPWLIR